MQLEVGAVLEGKVTGITKFGAFVSLPGNRTGMVHISEIAPTFVKEIRDFVTENQTVKVLNISEDGKISLSMKKAVEPAAAAPAQRRPARPGSFEWQATKKEPSSFEDMMSSFKKSSDEKMSDLKKCMDSKRGGFSRRGGQSRQG